VPTTAPDQAVDYTTLTDKQLRGLYAKGIRNKHTRRANADYQRARLALKRGDVATSKTSGGGEDIAAHSANEGDTAAAAPAGLGATTGTPEPDAAPRNLTPPEPAKTTPPRPANQVNMTASTGTVRRLRGLAVIGITPDRIAELTRIRLSDIWWLLMKPPAGIPVAVHNRVAETFKTLRTQPVTPEPKTIGGAAAAQIIALADDQKWPGPFDWDRIDADLAPVATHRHRDQAVLQAAIDETSIHPIPAVVDTAALATERERADAADKRSADLQAQLQRAQDLAAELRKTAGSRALVIDGLKHDVDQERHLVAELRATIESQVRTIGDLRDDLKHAQSDYETAVKAGDALLTEKQRLEAVLATTDLQAAAQRADDSTPVEVDSSSTIMRELRKLIAPLSVSGITMHVTIGEPR